MGCWSKAEVSGPVVACDIGHSVAVEPSIGGLPCEGESEAQGTVRKTRALPEGEAADGLRLGTPESPESQLRVSEGMVSNESRVRESRTLGSMSGERNRGQGGDRGTGTGARVVGELLIAPSSTSAPPRLYWPVENVRSLLQKSTQRSRGSTLGFDTAPARAGSLSGGRVYAVSRAFDYRYRRSRKPSDLCTRLLLKFRKVFAETRLEK